MNTKTEMTAHTAGNESWACPALEIGDTDDNGALEIRAVDGDVVARVDVVGEYWNDDAQAKMAALMCAAPDLLRALLAFRDGGPTGGRNFAEWHNSYAPAIKLARAAIAKATGAK